MIRKLNKYEPAEVFHIGFAQTTILSEKILPLFDTGVISGSYLWRVWPFEVYDENELAD